MATTHTDTQVNQLVINKMTKQEYDNLSQVSDTELYLVEEQVDSVVTENSTNPVQSGAVYEALQQSSSNIKDGTTTFTKNNETIGTTSANQSVNQTIALPNDVVMCNLIDNKALASYATPITRFKYIEDHGWVDMDRSNIQYNEGTGEWTGTFVSLDITEGEYYYDMDNDIVFVVDENSEMQDVTSTVVIQGDSNKLYCDTTTNMLYRYDGINFVALTSEGKTYTLSSNNENIRLTDSDGQTQDLSLNTLINGLSTGNSDPQDDDYIISQYVNGGTTTTTYHRRPLSKFWNWIKSKLGIGTNDGTFLRKDGTWVTPSDSTKVAKAGDTMSGNLTTPALKISGGRTQNSGDDEGIVIATNSNNFAALTLAVGGDPQTASGKYHSTFYLKGTEPYNMYWRASVSGTNYDIQHPKKSGTIALTSDIPSSLPANGGTATNVSGTVAIANGGTGAITAAAARTNLGLGSAATLTADTEASNNTIVKRTANGYINATYFNQSSSAETPTSSSYIMYCNSDGYLRKSSIANIKSLVNTNTTYSAGTGLSLSDTTFSVSYGTTATTACAGNDSRLSNSRPASDVYAWAKSASLAAAMQSSIDSGSVTTGTNCTCSVSWQRVGNLVSFTGYIKPNSSYTTAASVRVGVPGTYTHIAYFGGIQTNKSTVFRLITTGYLENEGPVANETYYFQVVGIKVI